MFAPQQIVVPVDFSELSRAAAVRAVGLAKVFDTPLHLVHALESPAWTHSELRLPPAGWEAVREQARGHLRALEAELAEQGAAVTAELFEADPVSAVQSAVQKYEANLIVMGTHGYSGLKHLVLGSVAERTFRSVDCPTLAVKGTEAEAREPIRRILYATDFSAHSERAAPIAAGLAKSFGAVVDVLHTVVRPGGRADVEASDQLRDAARDAIGRAMAQFENEGISAEPHLHQGVASEVIAREAVRLGADLIVMGTRGNTGLKHVFLGSVAERLLRAAQCPVLATKEGDRT